MTTTFEVGKTYDTGRGRDYVWTFTVTARTAKFITIRDEQGETCRVGVRVWDGVEACKPLGSYSMAPVMTAERIAPEPVETTFEVSDEMIRHWMQTANHHARVTGVPSAKRCIEDAADVYTKEQNTAALRWLLRSLGHSVGVFHADTKEIALLVAQTDHTVA